MCNLRNRSSQRKTVIQDVKTSGIDPAAQTNIVESKMAAVRMNSSDVRRKLKEAYISPDTFTQAERILVRYEQRRFYKEEADALVSNRPLKKTSSILKLDPVLDEGLLRVGGRLDRANVVYDAKHPVILPKTSSLTPLILKHVHQSVGHQGKNAMLNLLRQRFWITGAASAIKTFLSKCVICRKYQSRPGQQKMADLPKERVVPARPCFSKVEMDYFGPIEVKRGRIRVKRYGVVFTCLNSRAVHLEIASSLNTDACINAIRRFIARRGPVKVIQSDNGTNLVGSQRELKEEINPWNQSHIKETLLQKDLEWKFNPPSGSHFGGVWERVIRSVRKILYSLLKEQSIKLDDESLQTLFCEVEAILNNRPISTLPDRPGDLEALTPNHLLLLQPGESLPPGLFTKTDNYVKRRWRQVQYLADLFWTRWLREYLPLLQERQKWRTPKRNLQINDIVLVVENTPRNSWALGRVTEILKDKRGYGRMVKVRAKSTTLLRPVDKLCLVLEADD